MKKTIQELIFIGINSPKIIKRNIRPWDKSDNGGFE